MISQKYKIMLVDDEEEVRVSIQKKIDWDALGFEVVGDAENGEDGLEKAEILNPDVVLTDIRMPYMDGLTMAMKLKALNPAIRIIIFSGFDDFEYAKQAISLNVIEYILKPVNVEELTEILSRVKHTLDEEIELRRNVDLLRKNYAKSLPILREQLLSRLVRGQLSEREVQNTNWNLYELELTQTEQLSVAVLQFQVEKKDAAFSSFQNDWDLIPISVQNIAEERLENWGKCYPFWYSGYFLILASISETQTVESFLQCLNEICKLCSHYLHLTVTVGVGQPVEHLRSLRESYTQAKIALVYQSDIGLGQAIYISDVEPESLKIHRLRLTDTVETEMVTALKVGHPENIAKIVEQLLSPMENMAMPMQQYQVYLMSIMNVLVDLIFQYELDQGEALLGETDYYEKLMSFLNLEELRVWMIKVFQKISLGIQNKRESNTKAIIREAEDYVKKNYMKPDLSVEMISRDLHISPSYFSTLFKKEKGQSYVAYLTEVRLKKAAELLMETDEKTYIIAAKVGYSETNYFSYVFKKKYGISPTKYRGS